MTYRRKTGPIIVSASAFLGSIVRGANSDLPWLGASDLLDQCDVGFSLDFGTWQHRPEIGVREAVRLAGIRVRYCASCIVVESKSFESSACNYDNELTD